MFPHELTTSGSNRDSAAISISRNANSNHTHTTIGYVSITDAQIWPNKRQHFRRLRMQAEVCGRWLIHVVNLLRPIHAVLSRKFILGE